MKNYALLAAFAAMPFILSAGEPASVFISVDQSNAQVRPADITGKCLKRALGKNSFVVNDTHDLYRLKKAYDVKALLWQPQGDYVVPEDYYDNVKNRINAVRAEVYAVTGDENDIILPVVFGTLSHDSKRYSPIVEAAQFQLAAELPNVYLLDLSNTTVAGDSVTFDAASTEYVGKLTYNKLVDLGLVKGQRVDAVVPQPKNDISEQLTIYRPAAPNDKALVVCPGGGYDHHAMEWEGTRVGEWLSDNGYTCVVLKYRFPDGKSNVPTDDSRAAVRYLRSHADSLGIDAGKVGIMGFSAGGHLASAVATHPSEGCRPAFQILFYPVVTLTRGITHEGSAVQFLGKNDTPEMRALYSAEQQVTPSTPPAFIALSADDPAVSPLNSINYFLALRREGVDASMHIYPSGGHGWGFRRDQMPCHDAVVMELATWMKKCLRHD